MGVPFSEKARRLRPVRPFGVVVAETSVVIGVVWGSWGLRLSVGVLIASRVCLLMVLLYGYIPCGGSVVLPGHGIRRVRLS